RRRQRSGGPGVTTRIQAAPATSPHTYTASPSRPTLTGAVHTRPKQRFVITCAAALSALVSSPISAGTASCLVPRGKTTNDVGVSLLPKDGSLPPSLSLETGRSASRRFQSYQASSTSLERCSTQLSGTTSTSCLVSI